MTEIPCSVCKKSDKIVFRSSTIKLPTYPDAEFISYCSRCSWFFTDTGDGNTI